MGPTDDPRPYWFSEEVERREQGDEKLGQEMKERDKDLAERIARGDTRLHALVGELRTDVDRLKDTSPGRRLDRIEARLEKLVYVMYVGLIGGPAATAGLLQLLDFLGKQ